ncbi:MAG: glycosyltransferase [Nitrospira sp.]
MGNPKILLVQLEFGTWAQAKAWSYLGNFSVEDGLRANGCDCVTLPALSGVPDSSPLSWLHHAKQLLAGQRFDQVWVWLVHNRYSDAFLEWVAELAPVRVGLIMESLEYGEEDCRRWPQLRDRAAFVNGQIRHMTHVLAADERDANVFNQSGLVQALFWPSAVPSQFITEIIERPSRREVAFYGELYGERKAWLAMPGLKDLLIHPPSAEAATEFPQLFNTLHQQMAERFQSGWRPNPAALTEYVELWRRLREVIFANWLASLKTWSAIVNLPSLFQSYAGRVVEAMAAGRPVISWEIPNRPRTHQLFEDGREILLYPKDRPAGLKEHVERISHDVTYARDIATGARAALLRSHTAEARARQWLDWIKTGQPNRTCKELGEGAAVLQTCLSRQVGQLTNGGVMNSDAFYVNLFVNAPAWSTPHPNADEAARWSKIAAFLEYILRRVRQQEPNKQLRMLDVGCGRGWLTNLATMYGTCEGIEPVAGVVEHARKLFPHLRFEAGMADSVLTRSDFAPYDVVLTSEVIEHVPHGQKEKFLAQLAQLLKPEGYLILTTPRGEMWEQWKTIAPPNQPVEDWVTEEQLRTLLTGEGFTESGLERIHVEVPNLRYIPAPTPADVRSMNLIPIYQVWACQRTVDPAAIPFTRVPKVSVIMPTYNRPERLRTALASLAAQTYQDFEVIVVNDFGCEVESIIAAFADRSRITTICHGRNRGLAAARNSGLRVAKGTYVAYLDDDDRYLPNHLETLVAYLDRHECRVAYTDAWRVHERQIDGHYVETARDVPYSNEFGPADLLVSNYFPVLCVMHARQCLDDVGGFDESLFAHEDWDLWIRMATRFPFKHLPVTTAEFTWRGDGSSMTSGTRDTYRRTTEIIYRKYAPYAELIAGVREGQQRHLQQFHAEASAKSYVCSIIIPVWNRCDLTRQCIEALAKTTDDVSWELIVVDNHSTDDTASFLSTLSGDVQIITNEENLGFAKACNQGARAAHGKYLVFLNNDTVPQPQWLHPLLSEVEEHPEVGVVGSKLLFADGSVQHAGVVFMRSHLSPYHIYRAASSTIPAVNQRREFQAVTAACMLIRREVFGQVQGFEESFINGFEDVDLCLKIREKGYHVIYQPRSVVHHLESQTSGRKDREEYNSRLLQERWGTHWWLGDEDLHYYQDGFKLGGGVQDIQFATQLKPLNDVYDRATWVHVAATQVAALKKDWESVKRELRLADSWPNDRFVLSWGAMVAERLHEPISRTKFLSRYVALVDAPAERLALIRTMLEQENLAGAVEHLQILLASSPSHAEGLLMRGILCMQREQYEQAEVAFGSAMREGADRKKCLMGMGMAAMGRAYTQGAWEQFLHVLEEYPDDAEAIHWLLRAGTAQNRWDELSRHLCKYLVRNPADLAIRFALAGALVRGEQIEAASLEYETLRALAPTFDGLDELGQAITRKQAVSTIEAAHS